MRFPLASSRKPLQLWADGLVARPDRHLVEKFHGDCDSSPRRRGDPGARWAAGA
jgi:hypothetical protein